MSDVGDIGDAVDAGGDPGARTSGAEKAVVGCMSCAAVGAASLGLVAGAALGGLYHAYAGGDDLLYHVALGGGVGLFAGARLVVPVEEFVVDALFGLFGRKKQQGHRAPGSGNR